MTNGSAICVAIDAMGGDLAPEVNLRGALQALDKDADLHVAFTGDSDFLQREWAKLGDKHKERVRFEHAVEVISMEDHAASAIRKKKRSSIHVGLELLRDGKAQAFLSAGNSGAIMAAALMVLKRVAAVERPGILVRLPTADGFVSIIDAGANVDCRPSHLFQFANMGSVFAEVVDGIQKPRVALLSNGSESHKGNELTRETEALLKESPHVNYQGYVEGFDLFRGRADVIVCDGFVGNVILKLSEGLAETTFRWFRSEIKRDLMGMAGFLLMKRVLKAFRQKFDYQPYGAAPLLGVNGMVLISHGSSTEIAIQNGVLSAKRGVEQNFVEKISARLQEVDKIIKENLEKSAQLANE